MSLELVEVRKLLSFSYDLEKVHGSKAFVSAKNLANDEPLEEKKEILNDGSLALSFPSDFEGRVKIEVHGSSGGEDSGEVHVAASADVDVFEGTE